MKKILSLTLATMLFLGIIGCSLQEPSLESYHAITEPTGVTENAKPLESTESVTAPNETEQTRSAELTEVTEPTQPTETTEATQLQTPKENTNKQENESKPTDPPETQPTQPATEPTDLPSTQPLETQVPEMNPQETTLPSTESPETQPPTKATEPPPESAGCQHDWKCIHHAEEGYWRAGIICDCGWIVYGDPDELVARWNAHSASSLGAESLLDHGGYGSVDEWIVDTPAYDEWVCRHCGEAKP